MKLAKNFIFPLGNLFYHEAGKILHLIHVLHVLVQLINKVVNKATQLYIMLFQHNLFAFVCVCIVGVVVGSGFVLVSGN